MKLLRLATTLNSTSAPYNQFYLGLQKKFHQTFCSLLKNEILINGEIEYFHGNGSIFSLLRQLRFLVKTQKYDVIHIHSGLTGVIFLLAIFPFNLSLLDRTVFTLHNSWNVLRTRNKVLDLVIMLFSKKVCTCGVSSKKSLPPYINFFIEKKTLSIVNGFDNERIDNIEKSKPKNLHFNKNKAINIICIGALNRTKNQIAFLKSLRNMNISAEVIFLGDGACRNNLINFSKNIPQNIYIKFKGRVSRDLALEHMLEADLSISLSKGEGMPVAILESMYAGCYMVLSSIEPHLEISPPPERCTFVDLSQKKQISYSFDYIMENIEKIKKSRDLSKSYSLENFSMRSMLSEYTNIYKDLQKNNQKK